MTNAGQLPGACLYASDSVASWWLSGNKMRLNKSYEPINTLLMHLVSSNSHSLLLLIMLTLYPAPSLYLGGRTMASNTSNSQAIPSLKAPSTKSHHTKIRTASSNSLTAAPSPTRQNFLIRLFATLSLPCTRVVSSSSWPSISFCLSTSSLMSMPISFWRRMMAASSSRAWS